MTLAMAAGFIVSPPGSMIDQGALHNVRTAALLYEHDGPFQYEALMGGACISTARIDETDEVIAHLVSDAPNAERAWKERSE